MWSQVKVTFTIKAKTILWYLIEGFQLNYESIHLNI